MKLSYQYRISHDRPILSDGFMWSIYLYSSGLLLWCFPVPGHHNRVGQWVTRLREIWAGWFHPVAVSRPSYLYNGNPTLEKTVFILRRGPGGFMRSIYLYSSGLLLWCFPVSGPSQYYPGAPLLTWFNFNTNVDKYLRQLQTVGQNYLSIWTVHRWIWGMDKLFHLTIYWAYDYLSMLGFKLMYIIKTDLYQATINRNKPR